MELNGYRLNDVYTIVEEIGSGGGGVVYKAYHERLKTYVVLKKIKENVKGILESRAEADILKNIKHTYLPRVYDFLEIDGDIFTVMDYIPGVNLKEALKNTPSFSPKQVLKWAVQLAEALDYLHGQKPPIVHSDIKPANIMLTPEDNICLIDFNISLAFDRSMKNSTGTSAGYSPPEQYGTRSSYYKTVTSEQITRERAARAQTAGAQITRAREKTTGTPDVGRAEALAADDTEPFTADETEPFTADTAKPFATPGAKPSKLKSEEAFQEGRREVSSAGGSAASGRTVRELPELDILLGHGVDERSDIYSLGATLYHLLTGQKPAADFTSIVPIGVLKTDLSEGFSHIIEKMMELKPENRYQNGAELLYAFQHIYELDHEYRSYKNRRSAKKTAAAVLCLTGAVCLAAGANIRGRELRTEYNRYVEAASEAVKAGNFDAAQTAADCALELNPRRVEAYSVETLRLYREGDYDACIRYGRDAVNSPAYEIETDAERHSLGDIYYVVGNAYFEKNDYDNAGVCLKTAINYNHSNSLYYRDDAIVQAKSGRTDEAEQTLKTAILLKLGEDSIYMVQGEIAFSKGDYEKAVQMLEKCVLAAEERDLKRRAVILCSDAYQGIGNDSLEEEIALLKKAEQSFLPQSPMSVTERLGDAYARAAKAAGESKDLSGAESYYALALEKFNQLYQTGYETRQMMENLAILYQQMGDLKEAESMMLRMTEQYPEDYRGYKRLAFLEADKQQQRKNQDRDYQTARNYYEKARELYQASKGSVSENGSRDSNQTDPEMEMLGSLMRDLDDGGWF